MQAPLKDNLHGTVRVLSRRSTETEGIEMRNPLSRRGFLSSGVRTGVAAGLGLPVVAKGASPLPKAPPATRDTLTVAACQILNGFDLEANTAKVKQWIDEAAAQGVDVVAFPEACLTGYAPDRAHYDGLGPERVEAAEEAVRVHAADKGVAVILGSAHWAEGRLYNSLLVIDRGGVVRGRYAKTFLAESWCEPGTVLPVYTVADVPSCFIVCHDVRYPELVRLPAVAGAQICYFCSHESGLDSEYKLSAYRAMPIARATENYIFLVMANAPASPKDLSGSHGNSKIVHPDGNVIEEAGYFDERLVTATIRLSDANRTIAEKCVTQPTILTDWLHRGVALVDLPADETESA